MSIVFYVKCRLVLFKINMYTRAIYVHTFNSIWRETNICPCHPLPSIQQAAGNYVNMNLEHDARALLAGATWELSWDFGISAYSNN